MNAVISVDLTDFFQQCVVGVKNQRLCSVAVKPMTIEQSRQAYPYRADFSRYAESRFGGDDLFDDTALLLSKDARRCTLCQAPTKLKYLKDGETCPDCDGRSEYNGSNPHLPV